MGGKEIIEVVDCIAAFLINRTDNEVFGKWKEKLKIKKILKKDKKNIEKIFITLEGKELYSLVEKFIIYSAFKNPKFYSPMSLSEEQENELWISFREYLQKETGGIEIDRSYRDKIVKCINLHNEAINEIIMDNKSKRYTKMIHKLHEPIEKSLNRIIDTLDTDTPLQDKNDNIGFVVSQIESIMKSYRFDICQLRKIQVICIGFPMLIIFVMAITFPLSLKYVKNIYTICIILILVLVFILISLLYGRDISHKLKELEENMGCTRENLMKFHNHIYQKLIGHKYIISSDFIDELEAAILSLERLIRIKEDSIDIEEDRKIFLMHLHRRLSQMEELCIVERRNIEKIDYYD